MIPWYWLIVFGLGMGQKNIFARNLNDLMKEHGMTVREAAKVANVAVSTIQNWRSGSSPNDYVAVRKLAQALNTTLGWLLTGEHDSQGPGQLRIDDVIHEERPFFSGYAYITVNRIVTDAEPGRRKATARAKKFTPSPR